MSGIQGHRGVVGMVGVFATDCVGIRRAGGMLRWLSWLSCGHRRVEWNRNKELGGLRNRWRFSLGRRRGVRVEIDR